MNSSGLNGLEKQIFIDQSCQSHPELATYIREILNETIENVEALEQSVEFHYDSDLEENLADIDTQITDYTLIKKIGSGGMGDVYQADQTSPVKRQVALKLLKNIPDQQLLLSEMQILAQLNHPNIATLYDVGKTSNQRLFLVMELICGDDIVSWCENKNYNIVKKINLFQQLCSGISFAHEKGIIHCDIKPSNVQISEVNNKPILKIIDFGISQLFNKASSQSYESLSGTPAYLSPEVLHAKGKILADTRRDVYALGILLYRLITGKLPDNNNDDKNIAKDLMAIINKAKSIEVSHRYANANDLTHDLNRFLNKQPVRARKRSWSYVLTRFVQRRFAVVVFSLALFLALIGGFIAQGIQAKKAEYQAQIAIEQSMKAKASQLEAEELTGFLMGLFDLSNPERANQEQASTKDLVDKANDDLLKIVTPTLSDARFLFTIGSIYLRMDQLDKAQISIQRSLEIKKSLLTENHTEIIAAITQLGVISRRKGDNDQAQKLLKQALSLIKTQQNPELTQLAFIHNHMGNLYWQTRQTDEAILNHQKALAIRIKLADKKEIADSFNNLGAIYLQNKQWELSQHNLQKALDLYLQSYDEEHPFIAYVIQNLGIVAERTNEWKKAEELYLKSYHYILNIYGKNHNKTLFSQKNLAIYYARIEQYDKSIELRKATIAGYAEIGNHDQKIIRSRWLAKIYADSGNFDASIQQYQQTLNWLKQTPSKDRSLETKLLVKMAQSYAYQKSYPEAIHTLNEAYEKLKQNNNLHFYYNQIRLNTIGMIFAKQQKFDLAMETYNQTLSLSNAKDRDNQEEVINAHLGLALIQIQLEDFDTASSHYQSAVVIAQNSFVENHKIMAKVFYQMTQLSKLNNQNEKAKFYLQKALNIQFQNLPKHHSEIIKFQKELEAL